MSQLKKGVILSYINIFLTNVIGIVLTPFIIRSLGSSEYGLYTLIGSFVTYLTLMDLGLNNTIIRFVSKYRAEKNKVGEEIFLGTSLKIYSLISLILTIFGVIIYFKLDYIFSKSLSFEEISKAKIMFMILVFDIAIALPGGTFTAICNAYESFVFPRVMSILRYFFRSISVVSVLLLGGKAISIIVIDTVLNLIIVISTIFYVFKYLNVKFNFSKTKNTLVKQIFNYSIWVFLLGIVSQFFWNTGQIVLGIQTDTKTIAIYGVGIMLGGFYGGFAGAVNSVFLPKATKMSIENSNQELTETMTKLGRVSFIILMFIFIPFALFGREFIQLWVGTTFSQSWLITILIMIVYTVPLIQNFAHSLLEAKNKVRYKVLVYILFIGIGIAFGAFLTKQYHGLGMAIGICSGWMVAQIFLNLFFVNVLHLNMIYFYKNIFLNRLTYTLLSVTAISMLINYIPSGSWILFIIKIIIFVVFFAVFLLKFGINQFEKNLILSPFRFLNKKR